MTGHEDSDITEFKSDSVFVRVPSVGEEMASQVTVTIRDIYSRIRDQPILGQLGTLQVTSEENRPAEKKDTGWKNRHVPTAD